MSVLGLDIGSNSVGGAWREDTSGQLTASTSIFPAGVEESEDKRGDPKNAKRRSTRRSRITLARRAERKRKLRVKLIEVGLLPNVDRCDACAGHEKSDPDGICCFRRLLEKTDPWELRRRGLEHSLTPYEFGRTLLHLAQRRGAAGLDPDADDDGKVKAAITAVQFAMLDRFGAEADKAKAAQLRGQIDSLGKKKRRSDEENAQLDQAHEALKTLCRQLLQGSRMTFGRFIADLRDERRTPINTPDKRTEARGPREWRQPVRNRAGRYEFCADRAMIRDEFAKLWEAQKKLGGPLAALLTDDLRRALDDESGDSTWRHRGLLFGQRRQSSGTLGRCNLHPDDRCVPHADMYASRYLVVETVNNLKIIQRGRSERALRPEEREKIKDYLSKPLGTEKSGKRKGEAKRTVSVTDLRELMGWGRATKTTEYRFTIEADEERTINTDWFSREIIHGAVGAERWDALPESARGGINRALLKFDPADDTHATKLKHIVMQDWAGLSDAQADALVAAWKKRPKIEKRLNMSRRAVRNLLAVMDRAEPWPDPNRRGQHRWLTQIEARKLIAEDAEFKDLTSGQPLDERSRWRYATGAKGATARDRHYMKKHLLKKDGQVAYGLDGLPLHEPPPAPMITNPVVRKAIHEVRRHLIEYMRTFGRKPDRIHIELSREARMGKADSDSALFMNRLRDRIKKQIIEEFGLESYTRTQQEKAARRVVLALQQGCVCPFCGQTLAQGGCSGISLRAAALGEGCDVSHIIPKARGGENGLTNTVLGHDTCNRNMRKQTPRELWGDKFDECMARVEKMYGEIARIRPSEVKSVNGPELWKCYTAEPARPKRGSKSDKPPNYFSRRPDKAKIEQFKKDVTDIQEMTARQDAATKYATRQVMDYLADALYDGQGLPERGGKRRIFAVHKRWTGRLRREWKLFFDPHGTRAHGLTAADEHVRKEKDRRDHRHHAIDAAVIALWSPELERAWDEREKRAERDGINTADEEAMENYCRRDDNRLPLPPPFQTRDELREAVRRAVFGDAGAEKPICHRPVKRKVIGFLHKATQYGPVVDTWVQGGTMHHELVEGRVTVRQEILGEQPSDFLKPTHLRLPRLETDEEAADRLARRLRIGKRALSKDEAIKSARKLVKSKAFTRAEVDPKPEKGGIVRDIALRKLLRRQLEKRELNPDSYTRSDLKRSIDKDGPLAMDSGVPIHRVVLLWSNNDPVTIRRDHYDHASGKRQKLDDPGSLRLYDSQNNHHIEIRVATDKKGKETWSGRISSAFDVAQKISIRLRKLGELERPFRHLRRKLTTEQRKGLTNDQIAELSKQRLREWKQALRNLKPQRKKIIDGHPVVDRSDNDDGHFVMSLCEGEMLWMKHKQTGEVGYFVVAKLDKQQTVVLVPHWDARAATGRKDAEGNKVSDSKREQFAVTPADLKALAPPDRPHAIKVRVSPLGVVTELDRD